MGAFEKRVETFRNLAREEILDPIGTHHELSGGMHGQKLDFDRISDESDLYEMWVDVATDYIGREFEWRPEVILGVANGTNRLAVSVASRFKGNTIGLTTEKDYENNRKIRLSRFAARVIRGIQPELVLVLEDVATTGGSSLQPVQQVRELLDAQTLHDVQVLATWQRQPQLHRLQEANVPYRSIIREPLPTYTPDTCQSLPEGFCAQGWELKPRPQ